MDQELKKILEENKRLKESRECKICKDAQANRLLLPCGHLNVCRLCCPAIRRCPNPQCRELIKGIVSVYFA